MAQRRIAFYLNDGPVEIDTHPATVVLDLIRRRFALFGTKEGCREGECGSCTVIFGTARDGRLVYHPVPSCLLPAAELDGGHLVTIEGLAAIAPNPIQRAFVEEGAIQCGFCTPGFIMALTGYLLSGRRLTADDALEALDGNICRCTGYVSIRRAVASLFESLELAGRAPSIEDLVAQGLLPPFFLTVRETLGSLPPPSARGGPAPAARRSGEATLIAGGTDIYIRRGESLEEEEVKLISQFVTAGPAVESETAIVIPAATTIEELRLDPLINRYFPGFGERLRLFASTILRNRATVGGNVVNASPIGDLSVLLLAMGATLLIAGSRQGASGGRGSSRAGKERQVPIERFFLGYKRLDLLEGEILTAVVIPRPQPVLRWGFVRVAKRERLDIPAASAAFTVIPEGQNIAAARIALGGVAPVPLYARAASEALIGRAVDLAALHLAVERAGEEIAPIDDLRGSAGYRRALAGRLLAALFLESFPDRFDYDAIEAEISGLAAPAGDSPETGESGAPPEGRGGEKR